MNEKNTWNIRISENNTDILCSSNVPSARHFAAAARKCLFPFPLHCGHDLVYFLGN